MSKVCLFQSINWFLIGMKKTSRSGKPDGRRGSHKRHGSVIKSPVERWLNTTPNPLLTSQRGGIEGRSRMTPPPDERGNVYTYRDSGLKSQAERLPA